MNDYHAKIDARMLATYDELRGFGISELHARNSVAYTYDMLSTRAAAGARLDALLTERAETPVLEVF